MSFFKAFWKGNLKHKKLYDEKTLAGNFDSDSSIDEVTFRAKYLGNTMVDEPSSEEETAEAVTSILCCSRNRRKKPQRVTVLISLKGIRVFDVQADKFLLDVSIYRISYCSADASHGQVFAFIANHSHGMYCHAFLCPKRKTAQVMSLTLARVFRTAYTLFADHENNFVKVEKDDVEDNVVEQEEDEFNQVETTELLIDFTTELNQNRLDNWECFEDEDATDNLTYAKFWNDVDEKKNPVEGFTPNHYHSFFGNSPWENPRANLLCS